MGDNVEKWHWPLMANNITRHDLDSVLEFLGKEVPILTQGNQVKEFEREWSEWLGIRHSIFVNSGSSANTLTIAALRHLHGQGEVIVPPLTWVSDIASVLHAGMTPVFVDIDPRTLGLSTPQVLDHITPKTKAVFLTHVLGYNAITDELLQGLQGNRVLLIEDVCESYGATFRGKKLGTFGWASNFSFYYGHHMSTIEGGAACTNDPDLIETWRMLRAHGLVREASDVELKDSFIRQYPDLTPDFIFAYPSFNMRSNEIQAVLGRSQLKRLDANNEIRRRNLNLFLAGLDPNKYVTDFAVEGSCNYAFTLLLRESNESLRDRVVETLRRHGVEFRRGMSGGGNQLRQPYLRRLLPKLNPASLPNADRVHFFGFYIGNYPTLSTEHIQQLCELLNRL